MEQFASLRTLALLSGSVSQSLCEAAREEFCTILGGTEVTADDIREIREHRDMMKAFLDAFLDGLAECYCIHGAAFYGDGSAKKELDAKSGGGGGQLRQGSIEYAAKMAREFLEGSFVPDKG